jgi:hypothetical protein
MEDVISNTLAERGFWRDFDNAFKAGDPRVINHMIESNPGSFQKLIPEAMDRYAEVNPEGFSTYVCRSVSGYLSNAQVPLQMALLERVLPEQAPIDPQTGRPDPGLQTVIEAFKVIRGVVNDINTRAQDKIEPKIGQQAAQAQDGSNDLESREMNVLNDEWLRDVRPRSDAFAVAEVQKAYPGKRFTPSEVASIQGAIRQEVFARVRANDGYQQRIKSLLKAKNKTAYAMTVESEHKKIIPGAVKRAVDDVLEKRKSAQVKKPVAASNGQQKTLQGATQDNNGSLYEWIPKSPARMGYKVDFRRGGIKANNTAYIEGRSKPVRWK